MWAVTDDFMVRGWLYRRERDNLMIYLMSPWKNRRGIPQSKEIGLLIGGCASACYFFILYSLLTELLTRASNR